MLDAVRHPSRVSGLVLVVLATVMASASAAPPSPSFRARHGDTGAWTIALDASSGRPRQLSGGAVPLVAPGIASPTDDELVAATRAFLDSESELLGIDPGTLLLPPGGVVRAAQGRLLVIHHVLAPHGIEVVGARVTSVVSGSTLLHVHVTGSEPVLASPVPSITADIARQRALEASGLTGTGLDIEAPRLVFLPQGREHVLAWEVVLRDPELPMRIRVRLDAGDARTIEVTDETVSACDPVPPAAPERRVLGGVKPERADAVERRELLGFATVSGVAAGADGHFVAPPPPYSGVLTGPAGRVSCRDCMNPSQPLALLGADGDIDFGVNGSDGTGNGTSTPADRATFFHAQTARHLASRWLALPWLAQPLPLNTNLPSSCNAFWDGSSLSFYRSSSRCGNAGEIRDVIHHEWGHGLDQNDGLAPPGLLVDAATGEAVADIVAVLFSRDSCIGESFFRQAGDRSSTNCSGVRDVNESATGHELGAPATLSVDNIATKCSPSGHYRGPLGYQGHCEGQIFGQAFWHLVQVLRSGRTFPGSVPLTHPALSEEAAWQLAEQLFFESRAIVASYAPSALQSIGVSAHTAFMLADDEGDGIANGTPHADAIFDAFSHHGIAETAVSPPTTVPCTSPADPIVTVTGFSDPSSGRPALRVSWTSTAAAGYQVLRADATSDASLAISPVLAAGVTSHEDRAVLPGRNYSYRVVASTAAGCLSPGAAPVTASPGALLTVTASVVSDPFPGNGDGLLDQGETAGLTLTLRNDGSAPATNASVTLQSSDPALVVTSPGPLAFGTIAPGASVTGPAPYGVRAAADAPASVFVTATAETVEGCLRAEWGQQIVGPDVQLETHSVSDAAGGDGDGVWEPGETNELALLLRNDGQATARVLTATISFRGPPVPGITLVQPAGSWADIAPLATGSQLAPVFGIHADTSIGRLARVPLSVELRIGAVVHRRFQLELLAGTFPPGCEPAAGTWCDMVGSRCINSNRMPCETREATAWEFDEGGFCRGCPVKLYALVECGREMHLPLRDVEGIDIQVHDVLDGSVPTLRCRNDVFDETSTAGRITWGFDNNCDLDLSPGEDKVMDCYITAPDGLCGIYELDINSGGFVWELYANCNGTNTPHFPIFLDCADAFAAFDPLPELALANLVVGGDCAAPVVTFDLQNLGCTEQVGDVPVRIESGCGDAVDIWVPGPIPGNSTRPVSQPMPLTWCIDPVTVEVIVDPADTILECAESTTAASCTADEGVNSLSTTVAARLPVIDAGGPKSACAGASVTLSDSSGGAATTHRWSDGGAGGTFSPSPDVLHPTYSNTTAGTVTLTLTSSLGGAGCAATDTLVVTFTPLPVVDAGPDLLSCTGEVTLSGATSDADAFAWSDGFTGGSFSPSAAARNPTYRNPSGGRRTLTLTARHSATGCSRSDTVVVDLAPLPTVNAGRDKQGCAGIALPLSDATTSADTFAWSDGGAGGSFAPSPTVLRPTYANPALGTHVLTLVATASASGCSRTDTVSITVAGPPIAAFAPPPDPICEDALACFVNSSVGATAATWDFGNGVTSTESSPCFIYPTPGSYVVTLTASNACGADATSTTVTVGPKPTADFTFDSRGGGLCKNEPVPFNNLSSADSTSWRWDFGDGTTSTERDPTHVFAEDGIFLVKLEACNACGCGPPHFEAVEIAAACNTNCEANSNQIACSGAGVTAVPGDTCLDHDNFNTTSYPCAPGLRYRGDNKIHDLNFLAGSNFLVRVVETVPEPNGYDLDVMISASCNPPDCIAWGDETVHAGDRTTQNDDFWVIVDGRDGTCGPYRLEVTCLDPTEAAACEPPDFDGLLAASDLDACAATGIRVTWAEPSTWGVGPTGAACTSGSTEIWREDTTTGRVRMVGSAMSPAVEFVDRSLVPDRLYRYTVHAVNDCCGEAALTSVTAEATDTFIDPIQLDAGADRALDCTTPSVAQVIAISGGSGTGFEIAWTPPDGLSDPTVLNPTVSAAGTYTITVTDSGSGCTVSDTVTVTRTLDDAAVEPSALDRDASVSPLRVSRPVIGQTFVRVTWQDTLADEYVVLSGDLDRLGPSLAPNPAACALVLPTADIDAPVRDAYFLARSLNCDGDASSLGRTSFGNERTPVIAPGPCP